MKTSVPGSLTGMGLLIPGWGTLACTTPQSPKFRNPLLEGRCARTFPRCSPTSFLSFSTLNPPSKLSSCSKHLSIISSMYTIFNSKLHPKTCIKLKKILTTQATRIQMNFINNSKNLRSKLCNFAELNYDCHLGERTKHYVISHTSWDHPLTKYTS